MSRVGLFVGALALLNELLDPVKARIASVCAHQFPIQSNIKLIASGYSLDAGFLIGRKRARSGRKLVFPG